MRATHITLKTRKWLTVILLLMFSTSFSAMAQTPSYSSISIMNSNKIFPSDAVVDANGNTYVIGTFRDTPDFDPGAGIVTPPDPFNYSADDSYYDGFVARYNADGSLAWVEAMWTRGPVVYQTIEHDPFIFLREVEIGSDGNIYLVGDIKGVADGIGTQVQGAMFANGNNARAFVKGLSATGNAVYNINNSHAALHAGSTGEGISIDDSGNVFITGFFNEDINGVTSGTGQRQTYYAKFNSSGTRVNHAYLIDSYNGSSNANQNNKGYEIVADGSGNYYVGGFFGQNANFDPSSGTDIHHSVNLEDAFVAKYNSNNALQWVQTYSTQGTTVNKLELDGSNNVYAAIGTHIIKLNSAGTQLWDRDLTFQSTFSINSNNDLIVTRLDDELRFLELTSSNSISYQMAPTFVTGIQSSSSALKAVQYDANNVKWVMDDIEVHKFDGVNSSNGEGIIIASYIAGDVTPPTVTSFSPADNATDVSVNSTFTVTFSEDVQLASGAIIFSLNKNGTTWEQKQAGNSGITHNGNQITVSFSEFINDADYNTNYSILISNITDMSGNAYTGHNGATTWNFTTEAASGDVTPPTVTSFSPADNATDVSINSTFTVAFSEDVQLANGALIFFLKKNGSNWEEKLEGSSAIIHNGNQVTVSFGEFTNDADFNTNYSINISNVSDLVGNAYMGHNGNTTWNFTTEAAASLPFITTWETTSPDESISIPTTGSGYNYTVDWGDGNSDVAQTGDATHEYSAAGKYTVRITGDFPRIFFNTGGDKTKIKSIEQWGDIAWTSMQRAFFGCINLSYNATDAPDLSSVNDMSHMFAYTPSFNGDISNWDVSNITHMWYAFAGTSLNSSLNSWDVSNVKDMRNLFAESTFNQDIGNWDVSSVTRMDYMFYKAEQFNQDIGGWDVSSVTKMLYMFSEAKAFNKDLGSWDVSNVTNMSHMFFWSSFNQDISGWDVGKLTSLYSMFKRSPFNKNINGWNVSGVQDMRGLFEESQFNQPLDNWDVSNVTLMTSIFRVSPFNQDISGWDVSKVTQMGSMFGATSAFNQDISGWDVSKSTDMSSMFAGADVFNQDISSWDVSNVTNMYAMFNYADVFNQDLGAWDVSNVENMSRMFRGSVVDQDLSFWDISSVTNIDEIFASSSISISNYDNTLIGWATLTTPPSNLAFDATGLTYCNSETARTTLADTYNWTFTGDTKDCSTIPPTVVAVSPTHGTTEVALDADITITFSKPIVIANLNANMTVRTNSSASYIAVNNTANLEINQDVITIHLASFDLVPGGLHYVSFDTHTFADEDGNFYDDINVLFEGTTWKFTTVDLPEIIDYNPAHSETDVAVDEGYYFEFDKEVNTSSSAEVVIKNYENDEIIETISIANQSSVFDINLAPTTDLPYSTKMYVIAQPAGSITGSSGRAAFVGLDDKDDWFFTTEEEPIRPVTSALSPIDNAIDVSLDANLSIDFDVSINVAPGLTIELMNYNTEALVESFAIPSDNYADGILEVNPTSDLSYETQYYIILGGSGYVENASGGGKYLGLTNKEEWNFTTENAPDLEAPEISTLVPLDNAVDVAIGANIVITFTEPVVAVGSGQDILLMDYDSETLVEGFDPVDAGNGKITISGSTITLNPTTDLDANKHYFVSIAFNTIKDVSPNSNVFAGINSSGPSDKDNWDFTTAKTDQIITVEAIADKFIADDEFDVIASTTSGLSLTYEIQSGPATISGNTVTLDGTVGTVLVEVSQVGDATYNAASATTSFAITDPSKTDQSLTFTELSDLTYGESFSLTAMASSTLAVTYMVVSGPATVSGSTVTTTGVGIVTIEATQAGDDTFNPATAVRQSFAVTKATITATVDEAAIVYGDPIPIFTITYSGFVNDEDATSLANEPTTSTIATGTSDAGTYDITLSGGATDNYDITLVNGTLTINKANQTINIDAITEKDIVIDATVNVTASVSSSLEVTLSVTGPATISGTTITLEGTVGTVTVIANQAGNINHNAAVEVTTSFEVIDSANPCTNFAVELAGSIDNMCFGESNGSIDITVSGGSGNYSHSWSNASDTEDISGLASGTYTVTVTDVDNSCEATFEVTITDPAAIEITSSITDVVAGNDGAIDLTVSGGGSELSYNWSNGATTEDITGLSSDNYTVTVTDENECTSTGTYFVGDIILATVPKIETKIIAYPNPVNDYLSIEVTFSSYAESTLELLDFTGRQVLLEQMGNLDHFEARLNVSHLKNGLYMLVITSGDIKRVNRINITH